MTSVDAVHTDIERLLATFCGVPVGSHERYLEREHILMQIFHRCGLDPRRALQIGTDRNAFEVDADFNLNIDGEPQRVAVEIRSSTRSEGIARAIIQAHKIRRVGRYDRVLVIAAGYIAETDKRRAEAQGLGHIDLLGVAELRSWLWKHAPIFRTNEKKAENTCAQIIREAMRALAKRLATAPDEIAMLEWRDMERVLREIFERLGFDTTLTRSGRDGGFDLSLAIEGELGRERYLVEVKHWSEQKPGRPHLRKLVRVTAREQASRGIMLSSSGFSPSIYEGIAAAERATIGLGGREKIVSLCETYFRLGQQVWIPERVSSHELLDGLH